MTRSEASTSRPSRPVLIVRGLLFVFVAGFMLFSPASRHLLPREQYIKYTRGWKFFRSYGTGICDVKYELEQAGIRETLDRYALFGFDEDHRRAPMWLRRIKHGGRAGNAHVDLVTRKVCNRLGEQADDLHVTARCADRNGWYDLYYGEEPICPTYRNAPRSRTAQVGQSRPRQNEGRRP